MVGCARYAVGAKGSTQIGISGAAARMGAAISVYRSLRRCSTSGQPSVTQRTTAEPEKGSFNSSMPMTWSLSATRSASAPAASPSTVAALRPCTWGSPARKESHWRIDFGLR